MNNAQCLSHSKWECKYHVVWIPKCRKKALYGQLRKHLADSGGIRPPIPLQSWPPVPEQSGPGIPL